MTPATLVGLMLAIGAEVAPAPPTVDKLSCVAAHESAQELRQKNLLAESRERLLLCSDPRCPSLVSEECRATLVDIDRQAADDTARLPPSPPQPAPAPPPGAGASKVPPGAAPAVPVAPSLAIGAAPGAAPTRRPRSAGASRAVLLPGGLAVAALTSAAFFGWRGLSQADELRRTCSPDCEASRVSPVRRQLLIADVSLLAGVGLGAVTGWMLWSARSGEADAAPLASSATRVPSGAGWSLIPDFSSVRVEYRGRF